MLVPQISYSGAGNWSVGTWGTSLDSTEQLDVTTSTVGNDSAGALPAIIVTSNDTGQRSSLNIPAGQFSAYTDGSFKDDVSNAQLSVPQGVDEAIVGSGNDIERRATYLR